jgi:drug/metabolite transporter (DMT)-like permease
MGEIAAIITAFCWAFSGIFFSAAGKKVGSMTVNRLRLLLAFSMFLVTHFLILGKPLPLDAAPERWFWLSLSAFAGLIIGDSLLFQAFVYLGVRIPSLIMASVPVISTVIAWVFLGERLNFLVVAGICLAVTGLSVVVMERGDGNLAAGNKRDYALGVICGFGGATGQAVGLVLAKQGMAGDFPVLSAVTIRMTVGFVLIWGMALATGSGRMTLMRMKNFPVALRNTAIGTVIGPFIGVWMSLIAIQQTFVGIASTLMALSPVILLPVIKWGYKDKVSSQAVIGTLTSIIGVTIIFFFQ